MNIPALKRITQALYTEYELHSKYRIESTLAASSGRAISKGPFTGLRYPDVSPKGYMILASKFLGTFEMELQSAVESACARGYQTVLNVGSADGYYTVGFAMRMPQARVIAWEMDDWWRDITRKVADLNGVSSRVELRGICTVENVRSLQLSGRTLLFSDCEGFEDELLRPENLSGLGAYDIIVECHDLFVPGVTNAIIERFSATHNVERIEARPRLLGDIDPAQLRSLPGRSIDILRSFEEPRLYQMSWLVLTHRG